mmetsp:Transcript_19749/g.29939  ORF Transcript_19749/g.29939 Transcript_19749/m.29939 type:complete len:231 (+) Transcript_19749:106-798(+)
MRWLVPVLLIVTGALSIFGVSFCHFVVFPEPVTSNEFRPEKVSIGFWGYNHFYFYNGTNSGDSEQEFWRVEGCKAYLDEDADTLDATFQAARVFAILTPIFAILSAILVCTMGNFGNSKVTKCLSGLLLLTTLFSGLSLLFFSSDVCETKNWRPKIAELMEDQTCHLDTGSIIVVVNTILLFLIAVMVYFMPTGESTYTAGGEDEAVAKDEEEPKEGGREEEEAAEETKE